MWYQQIQIVPVVRNFPVFTGKNHCNRKSAFIDYTWEDMCSIRCDAITILLRRRHERYDRNTNRSFGDMERSKCWWTGSRACNAQRIKKIRNSSKMIFWIVPFLCHLNNLKNENMLDLLFIWTYCVKCKLTRFCVGYNKTNCASKRKYIF